MSIKDKYVVRSIDTNQTKEWLLKKHYAKRIPSISYAFGLFQDTLVGVCTFGMSPNYAEMMAWKPFEILELNRLVVKDGLDKNSLSFFLGKCLGMIPKSKVIISYSDLKMYHHGYIYQATNWVYTGIGGEGHPIYIMKDGTERHPRHEDKLNMELVERVEKTTGKARYYYFCADKKTKRELIKKLRFPVLPYPKGENKRYDSSYNPQVQISMF